MSFRDAYLRQSKLGLENLLAISTLGRRLKSLPVKGSRGLGVTLVEGEVSLKVECLGHDRLGFNLVCQAQCFSQGFLSFVPASRIGERAAIAAQDFRHHVATVLKFPKRFNSLLFGIHGGAVAPLDAEQGPNTV